MTTPILNSIIHLDAPVPQDYRVERLITHDGRWLALLARTTEPNVVIHFGGPWGYASKAGLIRALERKIVTK